MRYRVMMLGIVALVGGCAQARPPQELADARTGARPAHKVVDCTTTDLGLATTSHCGTGFFNPLSAAAE